MKNNLIGDLTSLLEKGDWNFSDEREFMENLFVGRFNYFLVVFSLFLTAGFANNFESLKFIVFYVGFIVLIACWIPLYRGFIKHDRIMRIMFNSMKDHPGYIVEKIMREEGYKPLFRVSYWMGVYIPGLCASILLVTGILVQTGCIN